MVLTLSRVQNVAKRLETSRINAMQFVYKIKPDSRGLDPGIHDFVWCYGERVSISPPTSSFPRRRESRRSVS